MFDGTEKSLGRIQIEISTRGDVFLNREWKFVYHDYIEVPTFQVNCLSLIEIVAEKLRACITRTKPRDYYDLYFLVEKGVEINYDLFKKKMKGFKLSKSSLSEKEWRRDMQHLVSIVPEFGEVKKVIDPILEKAYRNL